jgi:hypothetical protein
VLERQQKWEKILDLHLHTYQGQLSLGESS